MENFSKINRAFERFVEFILAACAAVAILTVVAVLAVLLSKTVVFFEQVSFKEFFGDTVWTPLFASKRFGIWALVSGSLLVTVIAMLTASPLGLLSAIYLSEFAHPFKRKALKPLLEILAGIPTVVYGYFALMIVTPALARVIPELGGFNALSPGIVMGIMLVPTVCSLCEDALYKTPRDLKEAAYSLGARKLTVIFHVILPYGRNSIIAALFLAFARAIGETMIVAIAAGLQPNFTWDPRQPVETMTAYIVQVSMGDTPKDSLEYLTIFAVGTMLFLITFMFHGLSRAVLRSKSWGGG